MYRIIVADDEVWIGFGIKKLVHRSGLPFEVIGEASNGIRAYDMIRNERPDLLITDIRMPGLNGLQLMKKLCDEGISTTVIFISGYAEFEYAREALTMGAFDYLLKPVEEESLTAVLQRYQASRERGETQNTAGEEAEEDDSRMGKIMERMNRHYTEKLSLGEMAEEFGLSIGYLSTLIKRQTGVSFTEYIAAKRIEDAKRLLKKERLSIEAIAEQVGYPDYFYFTKTFRKYVGVSPSVYRKKERM